MYTRYEKIKIMIASNKATSTIKGDTKNPAGAKGATGATNSTATATPTPTPTTTTTPTPTTTSKTGDKKPGSATTASPSSSKNAKLEINAFIQSMNKVLPDYKNNAGASLSASDRERKAVICRDLFDDAMKLADNPGFGLAFSQLQKKALNIPAKPVREELVKVGLQNDPDIALAVVVLEISQSVNSLSLELLRRDHHGAADGDIFKDPMRRLTSKATANLQLRGQFVEMDIDVPDDPGLLANHWTGGIFDLASSVPRFRTLEWPDVKNVMDSKSGQKMLIPDKEKIERIYTGELGLQKDAEYIPSIRKEMRSNKLGLDVAHKFESSNKTSVKDLTPDDIDSFDPATNGNDPGDNGTGGGMNRSGLNSIRNRIRSAVAVAKTESRERPVPLARPSPFARRAAPNDDVGGRGRSDGGGGAGRGYGTAAGDADSGGYTGADDVDPGGSYGNGTSPEDKELLEQQRLEKLKERQAEAKAMMEEDREKSSQAMEAANNLRDQEDLAFAEENQQRLLDNVDRAKERVQASDEFNATGKNFRGPTDLINELAAGAPSFSGTGGVIQSYESNEELVASVSGGKAMHGLSVLMNEYPITSGGVPLLKTPEYVEMYGVTQPFSTSTYKTTQESEMSSFDKTSTSGGMSMAESTSKSKSASVSGSYGGFSGSASGAISSGSKSSSGSTFENSESSERNLKTSTAIMVEYVKMPMKCFRVPYDSMRLSEDAKKAIIRISTEREAVNFLATFGSHLPFGMSTLGGVFFRKITMTTQTEVSSTSLFAAAGDTMSAETSEGKTATVSAGYSGFGASVSASASASSASKSGSSSFNANSSGNGSKEANTNSFYTMTVTSLGPNATTMDEFAAAISQNTGTWTIIDRGELDQVIPVWELIQDELLDGADPSNKISLDILGTDESPNSNDSLTLIKEKENARIFQIERAIRLMKRVWAQRAEEFMDQASPPNLPSALLRNIEDYVAVNDAIGQMVQCICTVIKPITDENISETAKGNRVLMLQSLKEVVGEAINAYLSKKTFEFGNWWIEQFISDGIDVMSPIKRDTLDYKDFQVEVIKDSIDSSDQQTSAFIRSVHARAAAAAKDLTIDAWEQLYDEFVPLAKLVNMRNFRSADDLQRVTKVWHISHGSGSNELSLFRSPTETSTLATLDSLTFHCADAVTPIRVRVIPPYVYDKTWSWWEWRRANRSFVRMLKPGNTYYLLRDISKKKIQIETYTGYTEHTIIENAYEYNEVLNAYRRIFSSFLNSSLPQSFTDKIAASIDLKRRKRLVRRSTFMKETVDQAVVSNQFVSEEEILQSGGIIIMNEFPIPVSCAVKFIRREPNGDVTRRYLLRENSVLVLTKDDLLVLKALSDKDSQLSESGDDDVRMVFVDDEDTQVFVDDEDTQDKGKAAAGVHHPITPGEKYTTYYPGGLVQTQILPEIISIDEKQFKDSRDRGSMIVSLFKSRRIHQWQKDGSYSELNAINKGYKYYCFDQFWKFVPTSPPQFASEVYDPNEMCYLIVNRKSNARLFARTFKGKEGDDFGFVEHYAEVNDSQKWQIIREEEPKDKGPEDIAREEEPKYIYSIAHVLTDRRLCLKEDVEEAEQRTCQVTVSTPEEYDFYEELEESDRGRIAFLKRHQWRIIPWKEIPDNELDLPITSRVLSRQTLPGDHILKNGGIIVMNPYPNKVVLEIKVPSKSADEPKKYTIQPYSRIEVMKEAEESVVFYVTYLDNKKREIKEPVSGPETEPFKNRLYNISFSSEDPLLLGVPNIDNPKIVKTQEDSDTTGALIAFIPDNPNEKAYCLNATDDLTIGFSPYTANTTASSRWELEPLPGTNRFRILNKMRDQKKKMYLSAYPSVYPYAYTNFYSFFNSFYKNFLWLANGNKNPIGLGFLSDGFGKYSTWQINSTGMKDPEVHQSSIQHLVFENASENASKKLQLGAAKKSGDNKFSLQLSSTLPEGKWVFIPNELIKNPNIQELLRVQSESLLEIACEKGIIEDVLSLIKNDPTLINKSFASGSKPIHVAVSNQHKNIVELLIDSGVDVTSKTEDNDENTALHIAAALHRAAEKNFTQLITLLLKHGAETDVLNKEKLLPRDMTEDKDLKTRLGGETFL